MKAISIKNETPSRNTVGSVDSLEPLVMPIISGVFKTPRSYGRASDEPMMMILMILYRLFTRYELTSDVAVTY